MNPSGGENFWGESVKVREGSSFVQPAAFFFFRGEEIDVCDEKTFKGQEKGGEKRTEETKEKIPDDKSPLAHYAVPRVRCL